MADIYTIETIDHASPAANQIASALRNVARAQIRANDAMRAGDAMQQRLARSAAGAARAELQAARALSKLEVGPMRPQATRSGRIPRGAGRRSGGGLGTIGGVAIGGFIAGAALDGIREAGRAMLGFADAIKTTAGHVGRTRAAFSGMLGSQELADEEIARGTMLAKKYGLSIAETLDQQRQFAAFGFGREGRTALTLLAGDMKAIGMSAEQVNRSMAQIGQIKTKGKLQGEELIVLAENGISIEKVYANLEKRLGKTREQILKMQKAGQLKSGDALLAITQSVVQTGGGGTLGAAGLKAAETTTEGALGRINALFEGGFRDAVAAAEPELVRGLNSIAKGLGGAEGEGIAGALTAAIKTVGSALEQLGPKLPGLISSLERIAVATERVVSMWDKISAVLDFAGSVGGKAAPGAAAGGAGAFAGGLLEGKGAGESYLDAVGGTLKNAFGFGEKSLFGMAVEQGKQIAEGVAAGINAQAFAPAAAATAMAQGTIAAHAAEAKIQSPSRAFADHGEMMPAGVAMGIEADQQLAFSAAKELADGTVYAAEGSLAVPPGTALARAGERAGESSSSSSSAKEVTLNLGGFHVTLQGAGGEALPALKSYAEGDFVAMLERHLESVGA